MTPIGGTARTTGILIAILFAASCTATPVADTEATERPTATERSTATERPTPSPTRTRLPAVTERPTATPFGPTGPTSEATVVRVIDGDTIEVSVGGGTARVRYIGIDTPETVDPRRPVGWMGPEASAANVVLVDGRSVVLERDVSETDSFGRLLRHVWVRDGDDWLLVSLALVSAGFAAVSTYPPDVRYVELFLDAQREARDAGRGLWGDPPDPTAAPTAAPGGACDPSYPDVCIPPYPPDLNCGDIAFRRFRVVGDDPHRFDGDRDGIGCES